MRRMKMMRGEKLFKGCERWEAWKKRAGLKQLYKHADFKKNESAKYDDRDEKD